MAKALVTDLYELTMAASYLRRRMVGAATFSLFVRKLPPDRGFLVAAGLEDCLSDLENFAFDEADVQWLREARFDDDVVDALAGIRFTGDVWAAATATEQINCSGLSSHVRLLGDDKCGGRDALAPSAFGLAEQPKRT